MEKILTKLEITGLFFVITVSIFLQNLYTICNGALPGIMFGSVNDSIWEITKTILISYLFWSAIEAIYLKKRFHRFVVAKVISLYFLGLFYIAVCLIFAMLSGENHYMAEFIGAIVAVLASSFLSYWLYMSYYRIDRLFVPSIFMLLLFIALYCSFTPFPPKNYIFLDRTSGIYGIVPDYIDSGDIILDTLYHI